MALVEKCRPANSNKNERDFVTVVSVGSLDEPPQLCSEEDKDLTEDLGYITVLKIGDDGQKAESESVIEEVLVYRLPGERLGFGLKFEGGTKASEFVKRLFIQSCAPDSPASRVRSSWGVLTEGDEVLEIDSMSVRTMTRIDCVRCLKDSNVVIKLLVKHNLQSVKAKSTEDLPLVVSAEKKRTPPPPPPVPPRKIPRKRDATQRVPAAKLLNGKTEGANKASTNEKQSTNTKSKSDIEARDRRLSDGSIGPPDAEVYVDLFSQESAYYLSESDDTGSSISTVVDRFNSFPTTATSSFAGSLPSTPTARQRQIDLSYDTNPFEEKEKLSENYLYNKLADLETENAVKETNGEYLNGKIEKSLLVQPPVHFQDAPLSYANEDMKGLESTLKSNNIQPTSNRNGVSHIEVDNNVKNEIHKALSSIKVDDIMIIKPVKQRPPPPPPRSKYAATIKEKNNNDYDVRNENCLEDLPRLVDFVPKSSKIGDDFRKAEESYDIHESYHDNYDDINWNEDTEFNSNWGLSCPLATIGEDEEETLVPVCSSTEQRSMPIVIVEYTEENGFDEADSVEENKEQLLEEKAEDEVSRPLPKAAPRSKTLTSKSADVDAMETPSINSRQPPDGHEFPDYQESKVTTSASSSSDAAKPLPRTSFLKDSKSSNNVRNKIAMFSGCASNDASDLDCKKGFSKYTRNILHNSSSSEAETRPKGNSLDMTAFLQIDTVDKATIEDLSLPNCLHMRSQSLIDISSDSKSISSAANKWSQLIEQRRKGLSKLKGLIIPEHPDNETSAPVIDLPEIKSSTESAELKPLPNFHFNGPNNTNSTPRSIISYAWSRETMTIPKYSPAFKRKPLQTYAAKTEADSKYTADSKAAQLPKQCSQEDELRLHVSLPLNDAPKSLESITSPTRSDCSFEYISSSSPELKNTIKSHKLDIHKSFVGNNNETTGKSEDESDNDSAVSSSQSSYISRNSPPTSPNLSVEGSCNASESDSMGSKLSQLEKADGMNPRLLKPQSVEAINRKNILASAKCRSGRDLKVGSPLIQRKFDEVEETRVKDRKVLIAAGGQKFKRTSEGQNSVDKPKPGATINKSKSTGSINCLSTSEIKGEENQPTRKSSVEIGKSSKQVSSYRFRSQNEKTSVTDLRKSFEKFSVNPNESIAKGVNKTTKPVTEVANNAEPVPNKRTSIPKPVTKSVTAKPHKKLRDIDTKEIVKATLAEWEETLNADLIKVVALHPDIPGESTGITLAGGTDYETKDVIIHKIRNASLAFCNGQLCKGDRVLAINGKSMNGITHAESISILKLPLPEIIIVAYTGISADPPTPTLTPTKITSFFDASHTSTPHKVSVTNSSQRKRKEITVKLVKDSASGLGFSVEGGKESPQGDVPLVIKKLFTGGIADKSGMLLAGDELIEINAVDVSCMSRIDAWTFMRKLPAREVIIKVRR